MHELITRALYYLHVHLLYASAVWLAAWALTSIVPGSATAKYWIWVATSFNFMLPLGAVIDKVGAYRLSWAAPLGVVGEIANDVSRSSAAPVLLAVWLLGASVMFRRVVRRIRAERRDAADELRRGAASNLPTRGVPVEFATGRQTPVVNGILRPRISLPDGIERLLSAGELDAVIVHEVIHARRRDNLIRLLHEVGLCALWFHPLVWITGSRIALYRELSCDEGVIRKSRGVDLVSALAKFANPEEPLLLQATVSSFLGRRLARLSVPWARRRIVASAALLLLFASVLLGGISETVAHTACCFVAKRPAASGGSPGGGAARRPAPGVGIEGAIAGVSGGVRGGIRNGVKGGIAGGVRGGVSNGIEGGVAGGIRAAIR